MIPKGVFRAVSPFYHFFMAFWSALFYGFPSRRLYVIGVTGTKGKTTVVHLLHHLLASSGARVASSSSLGIRIGEDSFEHASKMTMPGRMAVQKFLHDARRRECDYAIIEVTSEGIRQFRHRFIRFSSAIMTSIHKEHIESHGSFEAYLRAKLDLFWRLPKHAVAVLNEDDEFYDRFSAATAAKKMTYSFSGIVSGAAPLPVKHMSFIGEGIEFDIGRVSVRSPLLGEHNAANILAALALASSRHISFEKAASSLELFSGIPGRMEFFQKESFFVIIDYAHTPESLEALYGAFADSQNICVLGNTGGGRDTWKRPKMAAIAEKHCAEIILTNEDPYDENPQKIVNEMAAGVSDKKKLSVILDRREAIREALNCARELKEASPHQHIAVLITGKGTDPFIMGPRGQKTPWDDAAIVREELKKFLRKKTERV